MHVTFIGSFFVRCMMSPQRTICHRRSVWGSRYLLCYLKCVIV